MKSHSKALATFVLGDLVGSVAWFPIWWYTTGFVKVSRGAMNSLKFRWQSYGVRIWVKNFFVPMYGQHDWTGRLISVFMRFVVLVWRLFSFGIEASVYGLGLAVWVIALPLCFGMAITNILQGTLIEQLRGLAG